VSDQIETAELHRRFGEVLARSLGTRKPRSSLTGFLHGGLARAP
jgi:hypothetical protein